MIDSHCHPDSEAFAGERAAVLERAAAAGVTGVVAIAGLECARALQGTAGVRMWATAGVHPHDAAAADDAVWERVRREAGDPLVIAIGEIGLDYHYDHSSRGIQIEAFERQLALAAECGLPVSIHCREAWDDCFAALARQAPAVRGVFHCFTGDRAEAERALDLGWLLSFSGMVTFPKLEALRAVAAWTPAENLLIETDAPYLAPVPHRGRRNEPAWVRETAARLAQIRNCGVDEIAQLTSANFFRLFPRAVAG